MSSSAAPAARATRRTRIVCISDTHNTTVKLPKGDVLIHAGDLTNQGSYSELSKTVQWLEKADFEAKIVIAGNHDITLDPLFYSKHGASFHNQNLQDPAKCLSLLTSSPSITYLQHSSATIRLTRPDGPGTQFTVFGSPYSPQYRTWAFMYRRHPPRAGSSHLSPSPDEEPSTRPAPAELWAGIPLATDILVTHTPPRGHCDDAYGCDDLRAALARVRPRLHVCGHVHQGRGATRVRWDADGVGGGGRAGDGEGGGEGEKGEDDNDDEAAVEASAQPWLDPHPDPASAKISLVDLTARRGNEPLNFEEDSVLPEEGDEQAGVDAGGVKQQRGHRTRRGRRETCVVNPAIVATGWPHRGGKRFNKPIVVDIDLPVWR
ncbi:Metallo-dependent phosphatase-like protein [Staphylotrichum tortipilum]|uniref:Metallo-dependent phosphatase-like protein n=1 Tax=Staphylotrichum tortipilum TaxID=2831512 RepID=A0AAN6MN74_9PEZI|nr:Metallo-dependent phosphatase-like protein [Staphylotrichum longicolle]